MKIINVKCIYEGIRNELSLNTYYHAVQHPFFEDSFIIIGVVDSAGIPLSFSKHHFIIIK